MKSENKHYLKLSDEIRKAEHSLEELMQQLTTIAPDLKVTVISEPWETDLSETSEASEVLDELLVLDDLFEENTTPGSSVLTPSEPGEPKETLETAQEKNQKPDIVTSIHRKLPELDKEYIMSVIENCGFKSFY